jgi:putative transcriptional regulator
VDFEWDDAKAKSNLLKHGIDFVEAIDAVLDPNRTEKVASTFDFGEERLSDRHGSRPCAVPQSSRCAATRFAGSSRPERPDDMSKAGITRVTVKRGERPPRGKTDWARIDAMTDEEVTRAALSDPDAQPLTPEQPARMRRVSRLKVLRQRLDMTQAQFADAFHLPITTLRDWEQHRSTPDAPARALLLAIERDPEVMRRLLAETAA